MAITSVALSQEGSMAILGGIDGGLIIWDTTTD